MILQDIFHYFCKYPSTAAIENYFTKNGEVPMDYSIMKAKALDHAEDRFPQITDYIFGVNEEQVKLKISQVKDIYMFIDYGNITSRTNNLNVKEDTMQLALTIAKPLSSGSYDQAEELLITEQLLEIITAIRNDLREDRTDPFVKRLSFPNDITPFFARELSNSYGWTLMFQMSGTDMV